MRSLVTYYSFSGNTDRVAKIFSGILKENGDVTLQRLVPKDEIKSFMAQCAAARGHKRAQLEGLVTADASHYDLVLIGSPVWAFAPVPAVNTYLDSLNGLHGKKVIVLLTSGSGLGVSHCFKNIRTVLESKGASHIIEINIPDRMQKNENFIKDSLKNALNHKH
jgi:flavodoxin